MTLKFATYNIQYGVGQDGRYDLSRAIEEIRDQDVVCLQEVTTNWGVCNRDDQPELLSTALNRYAAYAPALEIDDSRRDEDGIITNARRGFGNMVLSRWPILYSRPHSLPRPAAAVPEAFYPNVDLPRTALEVVIDFEGTALRVFSLHLSHLPGPQQQAQVEALKNLAFTLPEEAPLWPADERVEQWSQRQAAPCVPAATLLFGDFNFEPDSAAYAGILAPHPGREERLIDAWREAGGGQSQAATCVENDGCLSRLDYLFATEQLRGNIRSAFVNQDSLASDHFPLYVTIDI